MARDTPPKKSQKTIVYDGLCTMCKGLTSTVARSEQNQRFRTVDYTSEHLPSSVSREQAKKEIHVVTADGTVYRNAAAVFAILEEYPKLAWLARIGRLPGIRTIASWLYRLIAARRHLLWGDIGRLFWLKLVIAAGLTAGIVASWPLWLSGRAFPLVPLFSWWPTVGTPLDLIILVVLIGLLMGVAVSKQPRRAIGGAVALLGFICVGDQMRWQPWVYQYTAMLVALAFCTWRVKDQAINSAALNVCRLILVSTYFWSGIHKLNEGFIFDTVTWMFQPITAVTPAAVDPYIVSLGVFLPILEIGIGLGLLWSKTRKVALIAAIAMHVGILILLGPFGHNWNVVVWPWNIAMIASVMLLFWRTPQVSPMAIIWNRQFAYHGVVLVLFGLLPALSLFGKWDAYLSSALYSSDLVRASIHIDAPVAAPASLIRADTSTKQGTMIGVGSWSYETLHVPPYPESRIFKHLGSVVCRSVGDSEHVQLRLTFRGTPFREGFAETYRCTNL